MKSSLEGWPLDANLLDVIRREHALEPWAEGEKIPWDDPGFSRRMLQEHLSQAHDAASRRHARIAAHVEWIHREVLAGVPNTVLDLGCGPGLYARRLALLGHKCTGVDFSPASIACAEQDAVSRGLSCTYVLGDLREVDYGAGFGLVMLIFGELNTFRLEDARRDSRQGPAGARERRRSATGSVYLRRRPRVRRATTSLVLRGKRPVLGPASPLPQGELLGLRPRPGHGTLLRG